MSAFTVINPATAEPIREVARAGVGDVDAAIAGAAQGIFFNQGEVCTCPSRALVQASIYDDFMDRVLARARTIVQGNPLDTTTQVGAQAWRGQQSRSLQRWQLGAQELLSLPQFPHILNGIITIPDS